MTDAGTSSGAGHRVVSTSVGATGLLALTSLGAVLWPDSLAVPHALLSGLLFVIGFVAFLAAYLKGIGRSRTELITLSGLFFLAGETAPLRVRHRLRSALAVEIVVVVGAATVQPYTEVAYGVLAPMFGLGVMALWGARHGSFAVRPPRS